jgi:hypothetical protein
MSRANKSESRLPVTGEVGSEGGSYAHAANQAMTFSGPANPNAPPADAVAARVPTRTATAAGGPLSGTSVEGSDDTASGMLRYPTEPPSSPSAREGRRATGHPWRNALIGAAAGAAAAIGVSRLCRRG